MHHGPLLLFYSAFLLTPIAANASTLTTEPIKAWSLNQLEERLEHIDTQLGQLAKFSPRGGMGSIGYRSFRHTTPEQSEWVQIDLQSSYEIDQIVLVPAICHDATSGYQADGFPLQFRIVAGTDEDQTGSVVASFDETDHLLPRVAPLIVPCAITASWIRIEASRLSPAFFDGKYNLELAEIMIFNGEENLALQQTVHPPPSTSYPTAAREPDYLVDGFVPYSMHSGQGPRSVAFIGTVSPDEPASLSLDLGETYPLNRVHLHSVELSDSSPQSHPSDFAVPRHMILEGANQSDFSDAVPLVDYQINSAFESGPVIMRNFPETACRYLRLQVREPYPFKRSTFGNEIVGFAEIEVFTNGRNIALGKPIESNFIADHSERSPLAFTDGLNTYGKILSIRTWMNELTQRNDLEAERPLIAAELNLRYARQKTQLKWMSWLAVLLASGIGFTILMNRMLQMRKIAQMKERFAADLHDELGANVHTIEMLNEISRDADTQQERERLSDRITKVTERTATSIRHFSNMLEADSLKVGLVDEMQRTTKRIATNIEARVSVEGADSISQLNPLIQADLFLFYKESLINIMRHSSATHVCTHLKATAKEVRLSIRDNGIGMSDSLEHKAPTSLKRRARLIGAKVTAEGAPEGGTIITLILRPRRPSILRKRL